MSDIFEEVEESLAQDKWAERWNKYGLYVYLVAALIVGYVAWMEYQKYATAQRIEAQMSVFEAGLDHMENNEFSQASEELEKVIAMDVPLSVLAAHQAAEARYFGNGDPAAAAAALEAAGDANGSPMEQLALLKAAYFKADELSLTELQAMLGDLVAEGSEVRDGPIGNLAQELVAAKAFEEGDYALARDLYSYLSASIDATTNLQQRAQFALLIIPETGGVGTPSPDEGAPAEGETQ